MTIQKRKVHKSCNTLHSSFPTPSYYRINLNRIKPWIPMTPGIASTAIASTAIAIAIPSTTTTTQGDEIYSNTLESWNNLESLAGINLESYAGMVSDLPGIL